MDPTPTVPAPPPTPPAPTKILPAILRAYRLPLLLLGIFFALFSLARVLLLIGHYEDFSSLTAGQTAVALLRGIHFDAAIIFLSVGPLLLMLMLPFPLTRGRRWQSVWGWLSFALFLILLLILWTDGLYFGYVHRHAGPEVTMMGDAGTAVVRTGLVQYLPHLLGFLLLAAGLGWAWNRLLRLSSPAFGKIAWESAACAVLAVLMFYGARGSFTGKRLKVVHAFTSGPPAAAYLALNGPFTILHSVDHLKGLTEEFYPWDEAVKTARESLFLPGEAATDPAYPLLRKAEPKPGKRPNVVLIMLESWDALACDVYRQELGLPPLGLTPRFDALCREGVRFSRFYASGQKSMDGMSALLCGYPTLPRTPYLGRGMEQSRLTYLGHLARHEGYETLFIQSSDRESFRNDAISGLAGFQTYLGAEDVPLLGPPRKNIGQGCWDHEMFREANRRLAAAKEPFLGYLYTACTHSPFAWPDPKWEKYPTGNRIGRYRNSMSYGDDTLGEFFDLAKKSGYFDRTVFLMTADHIGGGEGARMEDPPSLHHIPCLVIAPGLAPGVDRRIGGQLDVIPTLADLAGWGAPQASLGRSLFGESATPRGALCVEGDLVLRVEDEGVVTHNLKDRVFGWKKTPEVDLGAIERRLLSQVQVAATLLRQNRLMPPDPAR